MTAKTPMTTMAATTTVATTDPDRSPVRSGSRPTVHGDKSAGPGIIRTEQPATWMESIAADLERPAVRSPADLDVRRAVDAVLGGDREAFRYLVEQESAVGRSGLPSGPRRSPRGRGCRSGVVRDRVSVAGRLARRRSVRGVAGSDRRSGPPVRRAKARRSVAWIDPTDPDRLVRAGPDGSSPADDRASLAAIALGLSSATDPAAISLRAERAETIRQAVDRAR